MLEIYLFSFECFGDRLAHQQDKCDFGNIETHSEEIYQWSNVRPIEHVYQVVEQMDEVAN